MTSERIIELDNLSERNIERAEEAIKQKLNPIDKNYILSISNQYYDNAKICYKRMIKLTTPVTSYVRFAANGYGYQSYGFYKAKNGNVYIIDTFMEDINGVYIPNKNIDFLRNII